MERVPITPDGIAKLREELKQLRDVERPRISKAIGEAIAMGDLSENAEYHAAKERQGMVEARIKELEDKISRAEVIDPSKLSGSRVAFGATVTVFDIEADKELTYQIVGADESDVDQNRISVTSPIARALMGKECGDEIRVRTPGGQRVLEIVDVLYR
ncbi:MAG TPA: transcription elongation factor GreA [Polyangiaceae bacterium]|jgi:transcription elongation factor GreA|nr:MAG: Transcription elongation factor GreA [Deltaproteobacteria bacterium ADurb.Bin207]HNS96684.1 transcription elongation factor GreA [Polyangiaceae bacterium]HNZ24301.1 transcription elongation factor GreA [Polyangiaceae bacterium]HOD24239.1 transcription elongation factor GreA [Polyangiaceae bacterium]HOE49665.1 transcription elongation factor GreA [Polyangiaceae bacterium]